MIADLHADALFDGADPGADAAQSDDHQRMSIREMTKAYSVTARTLRHYEDCGIVSPDRDGQHRLYSRRDRARLKLALMGKRVGFSLAEIKEMLDLYDLKDGKETQLRVAADRFNAQIAVLEEQKKDIETAINELRRTVGVVEGLLTEKSRKASDAL